MTENKYKPIGFFDSGMGGISVLNTAKKIMPSENFIYYADNLNSPYGNYNDEKILNLCKAGITELLKEVKALVVACNTVTAAAIKNIRNMTDIPVIGLEPAITPALKYTKTGKILLLATKATLRCKNYSQDLDDILISCPCIGLASFIEKYYFNDSKIFDYIKYILKPYDSINYDCLVLGCTHYVLKRNLFEIACKNKAVVFDGNMGAVQNLYRILEKNKLLNDSKTISNTRLLMTDKKENKYLNYTEIIKYM